MRGVTADTGEVVTANWPDELPDGIVMVAGTVAEALPERRLTTIPPAGADPVSNTVPTQSLPPDTFVGCTETDAIVVEVIARDAVWVLAPLLAVMTTVSAFAMPTVEILNVLDVEPGATVA